MRLLPALILLLAALSAVPGASAQDLPPPCGPLAAAVTVPADLAPGERGEVTVTVWNNGTRAAQVTVAARAEGEGWDASTDAEPDAVESGQAGSFVFAVSPTTAATGDLSYTFDVSADCALPGPLGSCPNNACRASAPSTGAMVRLAAPAGGGLPGLDNLVFPLEYLVAGIVLVGAATAIPFLLRKKGGGFVADCPEPLKMIRPGRGTSFPIEVRNMGNDPLVARFEIGPVPEGWTAFMPLPEVQLAPREARSLWLMVRSPAGASEGEAVDVELSLRNPARPDVGSTVRVRAEVNPAAADGAVRA